MGTPEQLFEHNMGMIRTLDKRVQPNAESMLRDCWKRLWYYRIYSARRTYEEQLGLYSKHRTVQTIQDDFRNKKITQKERDDLLALFAAGKNQFDTATRTDTVSGSKHLKGIAIDIVPTGGGSFGDIEKAGKPYGVSRPLINIGDFNHYEFALPEPVPEVPEPKTNPTPETTLKGLMRRFLKETRESAKRTIQRAIDRLTKRSKPL